MAFTSRSQLRTEIAAYLHRTDISASQLDNFIDSAAQRLGSGLRSQSNEGRNILQPIGSGTDPDAYQLPADWAETRALYSADNCLLKPLGQTEADRIDPDSSVAQGYLMTAVQELVGQAAAEYAIRLLPDTGEDITLYYYQLPLLVFPVGDSASHPVLVRYPYLYLNACLVEAHQFTQDYQQRDQVLQLLAAELQVANEMAMKARTAPGATVAAAHQRLASSAPPRSM